MTWAFDARQVDPGSAFELWPEGWFPVVITGAEERPDRNEESPGMSWFLAIKGLDGPVKDKTAQIEIAYKSGNAQRKDISLKQMSAIMHVTNVLSFDHPNRLANIPFYVKSGHRKGKGDSSEKVFQQWADFKNMANETAQDIYKRNNGGGGTTQQQQAPAGFGQQQQPVPQFAQQPQPQPQQFVQQQPVQQFAQPQPQPQFAPQPGQPGPASVPGYPQDGSGQPVQQQQQPQPVQYQQPQPAAAQPGAWPAQPQQAPQQAPQPQFAQQQPQAAPAQAPWGQ